MTTLKRCAALALIWLAAAASAALNGPPTTDVWTTAARNATQANEAFARCNRMVHAWYKHKSAVSFLLPQNLRSRVWNGHNSAADLWSFFVITAHLTDHDGLGSLVRQTLADDIRLATRLGTLTDDYHIDRSTFVRTDINLPRILFANSEYVKDGLLPIIELMGHTVWFHRARELVDDVCTRGVTDTRFGKIPSDSAEVNGEMLQNLCRLYAATGDPRYKQWAFRIGDAYFLDALPRCNHLPCHSWDFTKGKPRSDRLSLSDHGNEIIFGLSEVMVLAHLHDPARAPKYIAEMKRMVDTLLSFAVNDDGLWFHSVKPSTRTVTRRSTPDTWGYSLDAVYALYMVTGDKKYRAAVHRALKGINAKPRYRNWGGADAFADSIESGIVLLNRIPEPQGFEWLEATVPTFLAKQRPDGIIEGWHGDGNYARTALMYALMKTAGTRIIPWRADVTFGAVVQGDTLHLQLTADKPWSGTLHFDYPRHKSHIGLALNYPRLNEYPEWFPLDPERTYRLTVDGSDAGIKSGDALIAGLPVRVGGKPVRITLRPEGRPIAPARPRLTDAAALVATAGVWPAPSRPDLKLTVSVANDTCTARLSAGKPWRGVVHFDYPRHSLHLGRATAHRWYRLTPTRLYQLSLNGSAPQPMIGDELIRGIALDVEPGKPATIAVEAVPGPPYGGHALFIEGPPSVGGDGPTRIPLTLRNETAYPKRVVLKASFGTVSPARLALAAGKSAETVVTCTISKAGSVTIEVTTPDGKPIATHTTHLVHGRNLVGFKAFDEQEYNGTPYQWCGRKPIDFALPAKPAKPHTLHLLWGSKGDDRKARLIINGKPRELSQGGYRGFKWLTVNVDAADVPHDTVRIRIERLAPTGAAFISQAKLTSP